MKKLHGGEVWGGGLPQVFLVNSLTVLNAQN